VVLFFPELNGAKRWIHLGPLGTFQPSELMKFAIIVLFAYLVSVNYKRMGTFIYGVLPFMFSIGIVAFMMLLQPHLSGTVLIGMIGLTMMFVGGTKYRYFMIAVILVVIGVVGIVMFKGIDYVAERLNGWIDPFSDMQDSTFQTVQSLIAIGSGGVMGLGLGQSRQKFLYLPEPQNDFIFSIVCEELGFIGALLIILLFVLLVYRGFVIASKSPDKFGMMLSVGLTVQVGLQAMLNIAVVSNTIPNTGISLPFFSYGGSSLMLLLCQMGIVLNISRQCSLEKV
jgi:cell division protein FtsW